MSFDRKFLFSSEQERRKSNAREAWQEPNGLLRPRSLWNQQPYVDSAILNRFTPMNDSTGKCDNSFEKIILSLIVASNVPNMHIQGQAMNINNGNVSNRQQWSAAPRGTILSVLEHARVKNDTMSSTMTANDNNDPSSITLRSLAKRIDPEKKNETYVLPNSSHSAQSQCQMPDKPILSDLVVEDFDKTLTTKPKPLEARSMSTSDDFNLLEGLTTGRFDAKNKFVGTFFSRSFLSRYSILSLAPTNCFQS